MSMGYTKHKSSIYFWSCLGNRDPMDDICKQLNKQKPAICRMLGPSGNPTLESIVPVIKACADREKIKPIVCIDSF
jgi:DNA-binding phage protein